MPPKKLSAKAIAAEQKKQNTAKAEEIVSQLKLNMGTTDSASIVKKPDTKKPEKSVTSDSIKKLSIQDEGIAAKSKRSRSSVQDKDSTVNTETEATLKSTSIRSEPVDVGPLAEMATNSETTKHVKTPSKSSKSHGTTSSSKKSEKSSSTSKAANKSSARPPRDRISHGSGYQYEIDCKQVADSIDVKDLQKHLETHLKVDGKKNNLGSTVSIHCEGHKAVIKSATFFPEKSLRFLSKKFLKKNWNIRVLSKNAHSYEYKYVGAP